MGRVARGCQGVTQKRRPCGLLPSAPYRVCLIPVCAAWRNVHARWGLSTRTEPYRQRQHKGECTPHASRHFLSDQTTNLRVTLSARMCALAAQRRGQFPRVPGTVRFRAVPLAPPRSKSFVVQLLHARQRVKSPCPLGVGLDKVRQRCLAGLGQPRQRVLHVLDSGMPA